MESLITDNGVLIKDNRGCVLFAPDSMKLYALDLPQNAPLTSVSDWLATQGSYHQKKPPKKVNDDPLHLSYREAILPMLVSQKTLTETHIRPKINRLTLNISNACNLFCSYCYADHGMYHSPTSFMSVERAKEVVERIINLYRSVDIVHYFGGEPLLNPDVIDAVGQAFTEAFKQGLIEQLPQFVATTNGTISADRIIELLKKWQMELTVSWDGPKLIHDRMRPMSKEKFSSYDKLVKTIELYRENHIPYEIECTYNSSHLSSGVSVVDLMIFFHENTGLTNFHVAPTSLPSPTYSELEQQKQQQVFRGKSLAMQLNNHMSMEKLVPLYREAAAVTVDNMFTGSGPRLTFASGIVEQIVTQHPSNIYCPAFFNQLSVAVDGSVYPCFMFIGDKRFNLGNILTDEFPNPQCNQVFQNYFEEFGLSPVGTEKWFAPVFSGCIAGEYISSNRMGERTSESLYQAMIEECLLGVALSSDKGAIIDKFDRTHSC